METTKTSATDWMLCHRLRYYNTLSDYTEHPAYADDEPAVREELDWLRVRVRMAEGHPAEAEMAKLCKDLYRAFGQIALSIRAKLGAAYREDELYKRINADRPAMVRARVLQTLI